MSDLIFTYARAIGIFWSICLGVNTLRLKALSEKPEPSIFIGNVLLPKVLRTLPLSLQEHLLSGFFH